MPLWPGSRTVTLIPSCANSIGGSPYSFANQHAAPLVSEENHSASRTLTTNHPSVTGASPGPAFRNDARGAPFYEGDLPASKTVPRTKPSEWPDVMREVDVD